MCIEVIRLLVVKDGGTEIRNSPLDPAATTPLVKDDDSRPPVATAEEVVTGRVHFDLARGGLSLGLLNSF